MMEQNEKLFAKILADITKEAKAAGNVISEERIKEAFASLSLNDEQLAMIKDYLEKSRISVGGDADPNALLDMDDMDYLGTYLAELESIRIDERMRDGIIISALAGDLSARKDLLTLFLPYVADLSKLYAGQGVPVEDLVGEGNVALAMGCEMLDCVEKSEEVEGFLGKMIMDAMERFIAENGRSAEKAGKVADRVNKVADAAKELAEALLRKVTPAELAAESGMSEEEIKEAMLLSGYKIEDLES